MSFLASYVGRCGNCGEPFTPGTPVFYDEGTLTVVACCGEADEPEKALSVVTPEDKVVPRGKTAQDRCGRCFQIPASNGVCGCS